MIKLRTALLLFSLIIFFNSCQAIGQIFSAGVWVGVAIVVVIIIILFAVFRKRD